MGMQSPGFNFRSNIKYLIRKRIIPLFKLERQPLIKSIWVVLNQDFSYNFAMQFTRKQIIDYLHNHHIASVPEISQALNLTLGNIRHHIKELVTQYVVEEVGNLPAKGRGRPTKLYCLSKGALNHNLEFLIESLLKIMQAGATSEIRHTVFDQIAQKMIGDREFKSSPIQRLNQAIQWLSDRHYQARWEASPTGPRVILGYCPYVAILDTNPEMCQIDTRLVSQLCGNEMDQVARLERGPKGAHQCVFVAKV
jgi:predicted ArsR family transcriptional regulator